MTKQEYVDYQHRIAQFLERENLQTFSQEPNKLESGEYDTESDYPEAYFSWQPCECCGSPLGGNREDYIGFNQETGEVQGPYSICVDCVYYTEYGQLDDVTMGEMGE